MANSNLHKAKKEKNDEFYTQTSDIEKEVGNYESKFENKIIYCNCDDPHWSGFYRFFIQNFKYLKLKKLITTHYDADRPSFKMEVTNKNIDEHIEFSEISERISNGSESITDEIRFSVLLKSLQVEIEGNGDFRNQESIEMLKEADIVVTNPPFSLFREYIAQLMEYDKKFLVVGHQNAIKYKEIFPLIKSNEVWMGAGFKGGAAHFINKHYDDYATAGNHKEGMIRVSGVAWFTNLDYKKRHEIFIGYKTYVGNESDYPKYDNYDAIEVSKFKDLPTDYMGVIGVPISALAKINPDQFKIVGFRKGDDGKDLKVNGKDKYFRILIKRK